jgi:hypothetical protein
MGIKTKERKKDREKQEEKWTPRKIQKPAPILKNNS